MEWMVITDASQAEALAALEARGTADCRQNVFINEGDTVYLYAEPSACVRWKCLVEKEGVPPEEAAQPALAPVSDANNRENYPHYMRLRLLHTFPEGALPLDKLTERGLPNVKGSTLIRARLLELLKAAE